MCSLASLYLSIKHIEVTYICIYTLYVLRISPTYCTGLAIALVVAVTRAGSGASRTCGWRSPTPRRRTRWAYHSYIYNVDNTTYTHIHIYVHIYTHVIHIYILIQPGSKVCLAAQALEDSFEQQAQVGLAAKISDRYI